MRLRISQVLLLLALGAMLNVAVAWACAMYIKGQDSEARAAVGSSADTPGLVRWSAYRFERPGMTVFRSEWIVKDARIQLPAAVIKRMSRSEYYFLLSLRR